MNNIPDITTLIKQYEQGHNKVSHKELCSIIAYYKTEISTSKTAVKDFLLVKNETATTILAQITALEKSVTPLLDVFKEVPVEFEFLITLASKLKFLNYLWLTLKKMGNPTKVINKDTKIQIKNPPTPVQSHTVTLLSKLQNKQDLPKPLDPQKNNYKRLPVTKTTSYKLVPIKKSRKKNEKTSQSKIQNNNKWS